MEPDSPLVEPPVVRWHRIYAGVMTTLYLLCFGAGVAVAVFREELAQAETPPELLWGLGLLLAVLGLLVAALYAATFFLPRKPWVWMYHIVLLAIGMASCCTLTASVALLVFWLKPETQAYFGWQSQQKR